MSTRRRRTQRFKPKEEIEWLSHAERAEHRRSVQLLTNLVETLERGEEFLTPAQIDAARKFSGSYDNYDAWCDASVDMLERTYEHYLAKLIDMAPHDLTAYHEAIWGETPAAHQIHLAEHLMQLGDGKLGTMVFSYPPNSGKSQWGSRSFVTWWMGRNPNKRVLATCHTVDFGKNEFSKPCRGIIGSEVYARIFPDVSLSTDEKSADFWKLEGFKGSYTIKGVGGGMSGVRADLIASDDLYPNLKAALSPTIQADTVRWWNADVMSRLNPGGVVFLAITRWSVHDVPGVIEKLNKDNPEALTQPCLILNIPAIAGENDVIGRKPGEHLWPERFDFAHFEKFRKSLPPSVWSSLYQGQPVETQGGFITEDRFQRYKHAPVNIVNKPPQFTKTVISVDTAAKGSERANYTSALIFRVGVDGHHYLVGAWRGHESMDQFIITLARLISDWGANYVLMESAGFGMQILDNHKNKFMCPLIDINPSGRGSKAFKFDAAVPWISSGKVLFPENAPWMTDIIEEFVAFPYGEYDDYCDAFANYTSHELNTRKGGTKKANFGY